MNYKVLFNPLAGKVNDASFHGELSAALPDDAFEYLDLTKTDLAQFFSQISAEDGVIIVGGDGTLNNFINNVRGIEISVPVYYYAGGNGNDFWTDVGRVKGDKPVNMTEFFKKLPTVEVNGTERLFINGVGFGIDGYCCEVGDNMKAAGKDKINYTGIAVKGTLFGFKPANAEITVDGVTESFKNVWIAPTMNGRLYGGGMKPTPSQDRLNRERTVSLCVFHGCGRLKALMIFPSLFKGTHVAKTKNIKILTGKKITVKFDKPCALQIDGETVKDATEYTVTAPTD